jgi:hypothetical protein
MRGECDGKESFEIKGNMRPCGEITLAADIQAHDTFAVGIHTDIAARQLCDIPYYRLLRPPAGGLEREMQYSSRRLRHPVNIHVRGYKLH